MSATKFLLELKPFDPPPSVSVYSGGLTCPITINKTLQDGNATDEMKVLRHIDVADFAASGTSSFDLQSDQDRYGINMSSADVVLMYLEHKSTSLASSVHFEANAVNGWTSFLGSTGGTDRGTITLYPGDFMVLGSFTAGNQAVSGTNKVLDVVNDDGVNLASIAVQFWTRK